MRHRRWTKAEKQFQKNWEELWQIVGMCVNVEAQIRELVGRTSAGIEIINRMAKELQELKQERISLQEQLVKSILDNRNRRALSDELLRATAIERDELVEKLGAARRALE